MLKRVTVVLTGGQIFDRFWILIISIIAIIEYCKLTFITWNNSPKLLGRILKPRIIKVYNLCWNYWDVGPYRPNSCSKDVGLGPTVQIRVLIGYANSLYLFTTFVSIFLCLSVFNAIFILCFHVFMFNSFLCLGLLLWTMKHWLNSRYLYSMLCSAAKSNGKVGQRQPITAFRISPYSQWELTKTLPQLKP